MCACYGASRLTHNSFFITEGAVSLTEHLYNLSVKPQHGRLSISHTLSKTTQCIMPLNITGYR